MKVLPVRGAMKVLPVRGRAMKVVPFRGRAMKVVLVHGRAMKMVMKVVRAHEARRARRSGRTQRAYEDATRVPSGSCATGSISKLSGFFKVFFFQYVFKSVSEFGLK
jgi:hypothetical protein